MKNLDEQLNELENYIPQYKLNSPATSAGSVGWHITHCLLTMANVMAAVSRSDAASYTPKKSLLKFVVMNSGFIPRGKVKAPKIVQPIGVDDEVVLKEKLLQAKKSLASINSWNARQYFDHPIFGHVPANKTKRFIAVHTNHHLKIIREILRNNKV